MCHKSIVCEISRGDINLQEDKGQGRHSFLDKKVLKETGIFFFVSQSVNSPNSLMFQYPPFPNNSDSQENRM